MVNSQHDGYFYNGERSLVRRVMSSAPVRFLKTAASIPYFRKSYSGPMFGNYGQGPMPGVDAEYLRWSAGLGDVRVSSIFQGGLTWLSLGMNAVRPKLAKLDLENQEAEITRHDFLDLLECPNPYCNYTQFVQAWAFNWMAKGTVYVRKQRDPQTRRLIALWPEPYWKVRPVVKASAGGVFDEFISGYEVQRNGAWYPVAPQDMIVWRYGWDPETREGVNRMLALLPGLFTDKRIDSHLAKMVANGLISQSVVGVGAGKAIPTDGQLRAFQELLDFKARAFDSNLLAVSGNVKKVDLSMDISAEQFIKFRQTPEQRFASVWGISVVSLLFGAGVEVSTYSNVVSFMRRDFRNVIQPTIKIFFEGLRKEVLAEMAEINQANGKRLVLVGDYSQVPEMQSDKAVDVIWCSKMYNDGALKHKEYREQLDFPGGEDKYIYEMPQLPKTAAASPDMVIPSDPSSHDAEGAAKGAPTVN